MESALNLFRAGALQAVLLDLKIQPASQENGIEGGRHMVSRVEASFSAKAHFTPPGVTNA